MVQRILLAVSLILLFSTLVFAQAGAVQGTVYRANGTPAWGAFVTLDAVDGGGHHHFHMGLYTNQAGEVLFRSVPVGAYNIAASQPGEGFASALIDVAANQTTHVTLNLQDPMHHPGDGLTPVDLEGTAIVVGPDSLHRVTTYYLNTDNDASPEYILSFGPPWYTPGNGAERPTDGQHVTIHGGLFSYASPQMVVVWQINGHDWRDPDRGGHGGYGGDHGSDCDPDSVTRVELNGHIIVTADPGWHEEHHSYWITVSNTDPRADFRLDFGAEDYSPENGAVRPVNGQQVSIVGGQILCPGEPLPIVIVYEINGQFWRQPGDTTGMGPMVPDAAGEPIVIGAPESYITAGNYPNPFNPATTIRYSIPEAGDVQLSIYDLSGRQVAEVVHGFQSAGSYTVAWDGNAFASGIYFYRVKVNRLSLSHRMVLMK
ncbi:MAG TPA: carboxypeptidase regulatory-like domain-containing protein [bacterium]|jgi:hypothetical protein